ncbi:2-hydroxyacid dehydrogenase [Limimaricola pyoseonensis]|uniref:Lactate dehydrogenase n=1 Tax=Limimaricola pyoseonensis TaxID=521013 RepID=A0A1G7IUC6_9RHOB|nr:2-hydroxyacid dehydrogenase [Limimaricola pyoseonensis]SDF16154.1 Lactate dehydrogenase [Limimaricola pyoseonensis]
MDVLAIGGHGEADRAALRDAFEVGFIDGPGDLAGIEEAARAQVRAVAYKSGAPLGAEAFDLLPGLGLVANYGVGFDAIDVDAAHARGVAVSNTPGVLDADVADLAVALLTSVHRGLGQAEAHLRSGDWAAGTPLPLARRLAGRKVGILGLGRIGHAIARRLAAADCEIHYWSRREKDTPGWAHHATPEALAEASDDMVVALVGGPETRGMVSRGVIAALGEDGVLVNISRGSCVDETALLDALENGGLRGAGLDVFENEPDIDPRFLQLDNVALQPHRGSATRETRAAMARLMRDNIAAHLAGRKLLTPVG